jgi:hypothetical protein
MWQTTKKPKAISFFSLGGAGSHYPRPLSALPRGNSGLENATEHDWLLVSDPLLDSSAQIRENLDDTWFHVRDSEAYLKEKEVCLVARPTSTAQHEDPPTHIDVMRLFHGV